MTTKYSALAPVADDQLIIVADEWHRLGHKVVFAFVIQTWGSSPRQVGSVMLIRDDQTIAGSVSGGCVEGAVVEAALTMMDSAGGQRLDFGVADADAWGDPRAVVNINLAGFSRRQLFCCGCFTKSTLRDVNRLDSI